MKTRHLYLTIAILGSVIPHFYFLQFLMTNGLNFTLFISQMMQTDIAAFFSWDIIISTLAVVALVITEGKKLGIRNKWIYIVFNLTVGVSLALPAFLYTRQKLLDSKGV